MNKQSVEKYKVLSFDCFTSSSYQINEKLKAANFIFTPSFVLYDKIIPSDLEEALYKASVEVANVFDHVFLNDQRCSKKNTLLFNKNCVNMEDLAKVYFDQLREKIKIALQNKVNLKLSFVQVQRGFVDCASYFEDGTCVLSTAGGFSSVHRHYNLDLSEKENKDLYQKCSVDHGHEYAVRVFVKKIITKQLTYKVMELGDLKKILQTSIIDQLHGKYLNSIVGNTSGEILIKYCYEKLQASLDNPFRLEVKETRKNSFFYPVKFF